MDALTRAQTNRSLRTIRTELDFLLDAQVLTPSMVSKITDLLPTPPDSRGATTTTANPTPGPGVVAAPVPIHSPPSSAYNEKHNPPISQPVPSPAPPIYTPTPQAAPAGIATVSALYAYGATEAGDLDMQPGDRIAVLEWTNADWARGRSERTGAEGIFPRSYTKVEDEKAALQARHQAHTQPASYGNMPVEVAHGQPPPQQQQAGEPSKMQAGGKKFGKKLGNAAIFGAGATIGSNIVNGIL